MEIELGCGFYEITPISKEGRKGLLLIKVDEPFKVGERLADPGGTCEIKEEDTVIWFENIEGARAFQDAVNMSVLNMLGLKVI